MSIIIDNYVGGRVAYVSYVFTSKYAQILFIVCYTIWFRKFFKRRYLTPIGAICLHLRMYKRDGIKLAFGKNLLDLLSGNM